MQSVISVLSGIGDKDAPKGSKEWSIYFAFYAKQRAEDATRNVQSLQQVLKKLKDHEAHKAFCLASWEDFCQREIGITADQAEKVLAAPPDATVGAVLGKVGRPKKGEEKKGADGTLKRGTNSATYLKARLDRDHPEVAAQVHAGTLSARAGAIRAGIIRELSPLEKAQAAFRRLTKEDQNAFGLWLNEQPL